MRSLVCAVLLCAAPAFAGPVAVWKGDGVKVLAYTDPCDVAQLSMVLGTLGENPRKAAVQIGPTEIPACYVIDGEKLVLVDMLGNGGYLMVKDFKEERGV